MGWSELTSRPQLDRLFKKLKRKYEMRRILTPSPSILIEHEGEELDIPTIGNILALYPDFVYIEIISGHTFKPENEGATFKEKE